ncbi:PAS domain S-box protein [Zunongwangia sp.]|uniref:PAS domain S-box protein n=1 Tax=Zunongwangia sp. TaxID=1965325 RepID=UPI003AA95C79
MKLDLKKIHVVNYGYIKESECILNAFDFLDNIIVSQCNSLASLGKIVEEQNSCDILVLHLKEPQKELNIIFINFPNLTSKFPVIAITNNCKSASEANAFKYGVSDYIHFREITPALLSRSITYGIERYEGLKQLRDSRRNYRTIYNNSPLPIWILDRDDLSFLNVNDSAFKLYGYTKKEFLELDICDLYLENDKECLKTIFKQLSVNFSNKLAKHKLKSGKIVQVQIQCTSICFFGKNAILIIINNVTDKIYAFSELQKGKERFKALLQESSDFIAVLNENLEYTYVSPIIESFLQLETKDILNTSIKDSIHPEDKDYVLDLINGIKPLYGEKLQLPFFRLKDKNNYWRYMETTVSNLLNNEAVNGIVINSKDVTDFVEQRNELVKNLERFEIVSEATSDVIMEVNFEKNSFFVSKSVQKISGYKPKDFPEDSPWSWWLNKIHPEDIKKVSQCFNALFDLENNHSKFEYRIKTANGEYRNLLERCYLVVDDASKPERLISSIQDITQQKEYIDQIETRNKKLEEIAWEQSHIVRAPLAKIIGLVEMWQNEQKNEESTKEIIKNIVNSAKELDQVVKNITAKTNYL